MRRNAIKTKWEEQSDEMKDLSRAARSHGVRSSPFSAVQSTKPLPQGYLFAIRLLSALTVAVWSSNEIDRFRTKPSEPQLAPLSTTSVKPCIWRCMLSRADVGNDRLSDSSGRHITCGERSMAPYLKSCGQSPGGEAQAMWCGCVRTRCSKHETRS